MKTFVTCFTAAATLLGVSCAHAQYANVIVAGQVKPGVYGRVEIGSGPPPVLVYPQPVVIVQRPTPVQPVYLHVPPGHAKKWDKHCHKYNACNRPVYFVKSQEYEPGYSNGKGKGKGHGKGHAKGHEK